MSFQLDNQLFESYFSRHYGQRWSELRTALTQPERQVMRLNQFSSEVLTRGLEKCEFLEDCYWRPEGYALEKNKDGLFPFYIMDPASVIVAQALAAKGGEKVLDMCAAPGGKSLIIAEEMREGELISNEISEQRRDRLMRVFQDYIPREIRGFITVKGLDGNQYGLRRPGEFDRVLADVPCTGERHLLENAKEFQLWTEKRTKNLAIRQYSLLSSAWLAVKSDGRIVYSTCSISPEENDGVIAKLVKKRKPRIVRLPLLEKLSFVERTE